MVKVDYAFDEPSAEAVIAQGGQVTIPDAHLLFTAEFTRSGHDLVLTGDDGKSLVVVDYFGAHGPVDLVSPNGAILTAHVVQSLAGPLAAGQYAQAGDQQPAEAIGKVVTLEGTASAQRTDGTVVELSIGSQVALGDVVQTGNGSNLGLVFNDGALPEQHLPAAKVDHGGWKGETASHHSPAPEVTHMAANDLVQNMANDMKSAAHHHGHQ